MIVSLINDQLILNSPKVIWEITLYKGNETPNSHFILVKTGLQQESSQEGSESGLFLRGAHLGMSTENWLIAYRWSST